MITKPIIYTIEFIKEEVNGILKEILDNKEICYLGEVFENKSYSRQRYSEWAKEFKENIEISDTIMKIHSILESRINIGGLKNKYNATMTIFNLKNNYNWKDKTELDNNINIKDISMEVFKRYDGITNNKTKDNPESKTD